jgi:hypothetical protein
MDPSLTLIGITCLACALLEKTADNTAVKHLATSLVCGTCVCIGSKITYASASKFVDIISKPVKETARIGKEKALDKLKKNGK